MHIFRQPSSNSVKWNDFTKTKKHLKINSNGKFEMTFGRPSSEQIAEFERSDHSLEDETCNQTYSNIFPMKDNLLYPLKKLFHSIPGREYLFRGVSNLCFSKIGCFIKHFV